MKILYVSAGIYLFIYDFCVQNCVRKQIEREFVMRASTPISMNKALHPNNLWIDQSPAAFNTLKKISKKLEKFSLKCLTITHEHQW